MKRILLITPFVPSNIGAGVKYTMSFIEDISKSHKVDIVLFKNDTEGEYVPRNVNIRVLKEFNISIARKLLNVLSCFWIFPLFTAKFNYRVLRYLIKLVNENHYDYLYFDFSQTFLYSRFINHHAKILMSHDVITQRYSRISNKLISSFCKMSERLVLKSNNTTVFTFSEKDSNLLLELFGVRSYPTDFYISEDSVSAIPNEIGNYLVLFAMWKRDDNHKGLAWFIDDVLPLLSKDIDVYIIGGGLPNYIKDKITSLNNIQYLGYVDNPYPFIANSKALLSPLFSGAGVKVKVIEALACGTPIIGTDISFEGISDSYCKFMISAEDANSFASSIQNLNISLESRIAFKSMFLNKYNNRSIVKFINNEYI